MAGGCVNSCHVFHALKRDYLTASLWSSSLPGERYCTSKYQGCPQAPQVPAGTMASQDSGVQQGQRCTQAPRAGYIHPGGAAHLLPNTPTLQRGEQFSRLHQVNRAALPDTSTSLQTTLTASTLLQLKTFALKQKKEAGRC